MSRVLDFRDLRERILAGEEEDDLEPVEDSPFQQEAQEGITLIPLCLSAVYSPLLVLMLTKPHRAKYLCLENQQREWLSF